MNISGTVTALDSKVLTSNKTGKKFRVHYVELDSGEKINVGFNAPFSVGENISVMAEQKYGELKLVANNSKGGGGGTGGSGGNPAPSQSAPAARTYASGRPFPVPKTSGEMAIIRQNALTNAVTMFCNGALEFVPGKDEMKSTDELIEEVIKMAYQFAEFSSGNREARLAEEMQSKQVKRTRKIVKQVEDSEEEDDEV